MFNNVTSAQRRKVTKDQNVKHKYYGKSSNEICDVRKYKHINLY